MLADEPEIDDIISSYSRRSFVEQILTRNLIAFWLLGLCNNFGYVVMLSAAKDILENNSEPTANDTGCIAHLDNFKCSTISTGAVLLADILPSLTIKLFAPFTLHNIPYLTRHIAIVLLQASSYLIVAYSSSISIRLFGVVFASLGAGFGEVTYLSLSSHFHNDAILSWSSGTGGAGIFGALAFAILTDHRMLALSPQRALLSMLIVPLTLLITYWQILQCPQTVHRFQWHSPSSWFRIPQQHRAAEHSPPIEETPESSTDHLQALLHPNERAGGGWIADRRLSISARLQIIKPLLKYMIPLGVVYFSEYFINQGLLEFLVFDCAHSIALSAMQQYRWYQVLYQFGVFLSRSSLKLFPLKEAVIPLIAFLQAINVAVLFEESFRLRIIPHIFVLMLIIFYEGLLGGSAYVNTFSAIHRTVPRANREFSISFVTLSDSIGIVMAGFLSIYAHNFICNHR